MLTVAQAPFQHLLNFCGREMRGLGYSRFSHVFCLISCEEIFAFVLDAAVGAMHLCFRVNREDLEVLFTLWRGTGVSEESVFGRKIYFEVKRGR